MISPNKNAVGPFHQEVLKHLSKVTDNLNKAEKRANLSSLSKNTYEVTQREMPNYEKTVRRPMNIIVEKIVDMPKER